MGLTHLIFVTCLAVPTLQEESCNDVAVTCLSPYIFGMCESNSYVRNLCQLTCGVCTRVSCEPACDNGACTGTNTCTCEPGWDGQQCQNAVCSPQCVMGNCTAPETCTYRPGLADSCHKDPPECQFPFIYNGLSYSACTEADHDKPWCATETDNNYMVKWKNCDAPTDVIASICSELTQDSCASPTILNQCKSLCSSDACTSNCVNGACTDIFTCECNPGFTGPNCNQTDVSAAICDGLNQDSCKEKTVRDQCKKLCSVESCTSGCFNGVCTVNFTCECDEDFQGHNCDKTTSDSNVDSYDCPFPWFYVNNNFTKQCIYVPLRAAPKEHRIKQSWETARKICQDIGGDLPRFNTLNDMIGIGQFVKKDFQLSSSKGIMMYTAWVRAYRTPEGKNYWADDDTEVSGDLLSQRSYYNHIGGGAQTTIEKECLSYLPLRTDPQTAGIYNHGAIPCDEPVRVPLIQLLCQKWIVEPSQYYSSDKHTWVT